ncbi:hypothetical protein V6V47_18440 [Micromonospora sp. CPCC 205539]|uniref:hypothetical protein n=1 Tax=Micromonospora sp. CPCC 205539 TaxID=3122408 RepID=UPI002FF14C1C
MLVSAVLVAGAAAGCTDGQPVASAPSSATPTTGSPAVTSSPPSPTPTAVPSPSATRTPAGGGCPVTAATLDRVPGLPNAYRITPDTVRCWRGWAAGWDRNQKGDGLYAFQNTPDQGWRIKGQGSAIECEQLGIMIDSSDPPPFCY